LNLQRDQQQRYREQDQIEWRRSQVLELSSQGQTERQIATVLQVGKTTVHKDLAYLSRQAKENLKVHIQDKLPEEYQKCMVGINQVLNMAWSIINKSVVDDKTRLQALALINDCNKYKMDLTTNGVVITDAIKFVQINKENLAMSMKEEDRSKEPKEQVCGEDKDQLEEEQEDTREIKQETTNKVF
jgi:DNA primase large subunit